MSRDTWIVLGVILGIIALFSLIWAIRLLMRLLAVRRALGALGAKGNFVFWGAIVYTIFPIDILPDPIYLDDVTVLGGAVWFLTRLLRRQATLAELPTHAQGLAESGVRVIRRAAK